MVIQKKTDRRVYYYIAYTNTGRALDAVKKNTGAKYVVTGILSNIEETKALAHELNKSGAFDAEIHNAGIYQVSAKEISVSNFSFEQREPDFCGLHQEKLYV